MTEYTYDDPEDDGVLEPADDLTTDDLDEDPLDTGITPPDRYGASSWYGVTGAEARQGETLDQLLAEEEPDPNASVVLDGSGPSEQDESDDPDEDEAAPDEDGYTDVVDDRWAGGPGPRSGRLVADGRLLAADVGPDAGAAGAEEAAVHVQEDDEIRYRPINED
jgi:Family of unknown function (DUF5709)